MSKIFDRELPLIGNDGLDRLKNSRVLVAGLGGVGGAVAETLVRSGVGFLTFVDGDVFEPSNLNRQLLATANTLGVNKAAAAKLRAAEIAAGAVVTAVESYIGEDNIAELLDDGFDYCVDAIDDVKNKLRLICACKARNIPVVSAMGAGNRLDCDFAVIDVFKTQNDPLARVMRRELKKLGIAELETVCALTPPNARCAVPSSIAAPPLVMGAMLGGLVVKRLSGA